MNAPRPALLVAAVIAAIAGVVVFGVVGSANRAVVEWVPDPSGAATRTELLAARHVPERVSWVWSCEQPDGAASFSTRPDAPGALGVSSGPTGWVVTASGQPLIELAYTAQECAVVVEPSTGWTASVAGEQVGAGGPVEVVVSSLDGSGWVGTGFRSVIVLAPHGFDAPVWRIVFLLVAIGAATAITWLLPGSRHPGPDRRTRSQTRPEDGPDDVRGDAPRDLSHIWMMRLLTALVVVVPLAVLVVVQPPFEDDGWVLSTVENFAASAQYGNYYLSWDAMYPIGAPMFEMFRWVSKISISPLVMRLPSVIAATTIWLLARSILRRLGTRLGWEASLVAWSVFLVASISWWVTLRPEPFTAACATVGLLFVIGHLQDHSMRALCGAVIAAAVAVTIHPAGLVAAAPLLAVLPTVLTDARRDRTRWLELGSIVVAGITVTAVGLLLRSDITFWRWASDTSVNPGGTYTWRDAFVHYDYLFELGNGPRRLSLLLPLAAVGAYLVRFDRNEHPASRLPVRTFVIALLLLVPMPSKWLWHFGALGGLAIVVVTHEWDRLRTTWHHTTRTFRAATLATVAITFSIAWRADLEWVTQTPLTAFHHDAGAHDLGFLPVETSNPLLWLTIAALIAITTTITTTITTRLRHQRTDPDHPTSTPTALRLVPVATTTSALLVIGILVTDPIIQHPDWSLPGQLLDSATGTTCGLADHITAYEPTVTTDETSPRADDAITTQLGLPTTPATPDTTQTPTRAQPWALDVAGAVTPWFRLPDDDQFELSALRSAPSPLELFVQYGVASGGGEVTALGPVSTVTVAGGEWRHVSLPERHELSDRVRLGSVSASDAAGQIVATAPYRSGRTLTELVAGRPTVVSPFLRFQFPCIPTVPIAHGVATPADYTVELSGLPVATLPSSPWSYLADVRGPGRSVALESHDGVPPIVTVTSFG